METYTFIKSTDSENYPNPIYAISLDIEELVLSDTYDQFGQKIGHDNAGDYSIHNSYSDAEYYCIKELIEKFKLKFVDEDNNEDNNDYLHQQLTIQGGKINLENFEDEDIINFDEKAINAFIKKWEEKNAEYNTVEGFNYWDGRNWQTVIVEDNVFDRPTHKIIENDSLESEIDSKEWIKDGFGKKLYESENYWIIQNYCQGSFSAYELYAKEEYDLEDIRI